MLDHVARFLFEDLALLLMAEAMALAVVLAIHRRRMTPRTARAIYITLGVCAVLVAVQSLIKTKREVVKATIENLVRAVDEGDTSAIGGFFDENGVTVGSSQVFPRAVFVLGCQIGLQESQVDNAVVGGFRIDVDGRNAVAQFRVNCELRRDGKLEQRLPSFWTVHCTRQADGWKIHRISQGDLGVEAFGARMSALDYVRGVCGRAGPNLER